MGMIRAADGRWYFADEKGNLSQESYAQIRFSEYGIHAVMCAEDGLWHFIDEKGNLSADGYKEALAYVGDFASVVLKDGRSMYRDRSGSLLRGEQYNAITDCRYIYASFEDGIINAEDLQRIQKESADRFKKSLLKQYDDKQISADEVVSQATWYAEMLKTEREKHEERVKAKENTMQNFSKAFNSINDALNGPKG